MRDALLVLSLAACGTSPEECRTYASDLGALLERAAEEPPLFLPVPAGITLVERADVPRGDHPYGSSIEINPAATWFHGDPLSGAALSSALADDLAKRKLELEQYPSRTGDAADPRVVYFVIDVAAPWSKVVDACDAAMFVGMTKIAVVFEAPQTLKPPPRAPIDDKLDKILLAPPDDRAHEVAELVKDQIRSCPEIGVAFEAIVARGSANKARQLAKIVPDALAHCACRVNMPNLRSTLFRLLYIPHPLRALHLDPAEPAVAIALPATSTWADAAKLLTPATRNAEFTIARDSKAR